MSAMKAHLDSVCESVANNAAVQFADKIGCDSQHCRRIESAVFIAAMDAFLSYDFAVEIPPVPRPAMYQYFECRGESCRYRRDGRFFVIECLEVGGWKCLATTDDETDVVKTANYFLSRSN
jgi:hypothetical protein